MKSVIYTITHKPFEGPANPLYVPLAVGCALRDGESFGYLSDATGDNISSKNPSFCELTGIYWIWKNVKDADCVGICHYRRYPVMEDSRSSSGERLLTAEDVERILGEYDLVTSSLLTIRSDYYTGFSVDHHIKDLMTTRDVIAERAPEYLPVFEELIHGKNTYFGNIMICPFELFDRYCRFLFDILFEVERRTDTTGYDGYSARLYGFLAEFLLLVYVRTNGLRAYESRIAIIGEKAETAELKEELSRLFSDGDYRGARRCILDALKVRPDLMMEASDINGTLRMAMEAVSISDFEAAAGRTTMIEKARSFERCIAFVRKLNSGYLHGEEPGGEDRELLSEEALFVAGRVEEGLLATRDKSW
ncbi:MAG: DUF4422 domain-containing protein [Eubacterium sp.]|nr:DUF4422 domain-containing protein [Eubacterium sp.]